MVASKSTLAKSNWILEDIVVEEFMNHNIPLPVVACEVFHIPPVFVELAITKSNQLSEHVHPIVQYSIKQHKQTNDSWYGWKQNWMNELSKISRVLSCVLENGYA